MLSYFVMKCMPLSRRSDRETSSSGLCLDCEKTSEFELELESRLPMNVVSTQTPMN